MSKYTEFTKISLNLYNFNHVIVQSLTGRGVVSVFGA